MTRVAWALRLARPMRGHADPIFPLLLSILAAALLFG
jgi:hypothetical protein